MDAGSSAKLVDASMVGAQKHLMRWKIRSTQSVIKSQTPIFIVFLCFSEAHIPDVFVKQSSPSMYRPMLRTFDVSLSASTEHLIFTRFG